MAKDYSKEDLQTAQKAINKILDPSKAVARSGTLLAYNLTKSSGRFDDKQIAEMKSIKNVAKFFKAGNDKEFFEHAIPLTLKKLGISEDSNIYQVATSKLAQKSVSYLKPVLFSLASFYLRRNKNILPKSNPLLMGDMPPLADNLSYDGLGVDESKESIEADCFDDMLGRFGNLDGFCDKVTCAVTDTVDDAAQNIQDNIVDRFILSEEEYQSFKKVLHGKGGVKALYKTIFPNEYKLAEKDNPVIDINSEQELNSYLKEKFTDKPVDLGCQCIIS